jgi:spore protease
LKKEAVIMIRTDLAEELRTYAMSKRAKEEKGELDGILYNERQEDFIKISTIEILDERGEKALGKPKGKYVTVSFPTAAHLTYADFLKLCDALAVESQLHKGSSEAVNLLVCFLVCDGLEGLALDESLTESDVVSELLNGCPEHLLKVGDGTARPVDVVLVVAVVYHIDKGLSLFHFHFFDFLVFHIFLLLIIMNELFNINPF